mmetsp:Transcript_113712/g.213027  ORF Transcript_113712/g.213027 Transcript_113712/m.213027 type:complete len:215 (+) Transcript_113712:424-1068(+)
MRRHPFYKFKLICRRQLRMTPFHKRLCLWSRTTVTHYCVVILLFEAGKAFHQENRGLLQPAQSLINAIERVHGSTAVQDKLDPFRKLLLATDTISFTSSAVNSARTDNAVNDAILIQFTVRLLLLPGTLPLLGLVTLQDHAHGRNLRGDGIPERAILLLRKSVHLQLIQALCIGLICHLLGRVVPFIWNFSLLLFCEHHQLLPNVQTIRPSTTA